MMSKGERTREHILALAAPLFNQRGYAGTALSDLMAATGLEKGGIYRHFESKDALALAAFDYAAAELARRFDAALAERTGAPEQLLAILALWERQAVDPPIAGGCAAMNTAIESDDTHPALRERARELLGRFQGRIRRVVREGVAAGELRPDLDPAALASLVVATLEGALMLTRLYGDQSHMRRATAHLADVVRRATAAGAADAPAAASRTRGARSPRTRTRNAR